MQHDLQSHIQAFQKPMPSLGSGWMMDLIRQSKDISISDAIEKMASLRTSFTQDETSQNLDHEFGF